MALETPVKPRVHAFLRNGHPATTRPVPIVRASSQSRRRDSWGLRALNVAIAALGLILAAPLMLLIALLIKLTSPGPVIYTQLRVGLDRRNGSSAYPGSRRRVDHGGRLFR